MGARIESRTVAVRIKGDESVATMALPPHLDPPPTAQDLVQLACAAGVAISPAVERTLTELAAEYSQSRLAVRRTISVSTPPTAGTPGMLVYIDGHEPCDMAQDQVADAGSAVDSGQVDFYAGREFKPISTGTHVATRIDPRAGVAGISVTGRMLPAPKAKPCPIKIDSGLRVESDGRIVTTCDGILELRGRSLRITRLLTLPRGVDFSTGHIDFDGAVAIREGIKDKFKVRATGWVRVGGVVDSAVIQTGGDLYAVIGIAGHGAAHLDVGGCIEAGYIHQAHCDVHGDVRVRREVINCHMSIGGRLLGPGASLIGGTTSIGGGIQIGELGSDAGTPTLLIATDSPVLTGRVRILADQIKELRSQLAEQRFRVMLCRKPGNRLSAREKHKVRGIALVMKALRASLLESEAEFRALSSAMVAGRAARIRILTLAHRNVTIQFGHQSKYIFDRPIRGPISIGVDESGAATVRTADGAVRPLDELARPLHAPRASAAA